VCNSSFAFIFIQNAGAAPMQGRAGLPGPSIHLFSPCSARVLCGQSVSHFLLSSMPQACAQSLPALVCGLLRHATPARSCMGIQDTAHARVCVPGRSCCSGQRCCFPWRAAVSGFRVVRHATGGLLAVLVCFHSSMVQC
jgi:hypothetical protein